MPQRKAKSENRVIISTRDIRDVSGKVTIAGGDVYEGYTAEQVSLLLKEITTNYRRKQFDGRCPYKGLEVFEEEDVDLFFGRERLVDDLLSRVKESRTVFITGPSGSGKSSLVRAGLIHALKNGALKGSERWLYETMKPGREPIKELSLAFSRLKSPELANYFQAHANNVDILYECAESVLSGQKNQRFVLFIDQFEEVFTQINQEEERQAFINMLVHAGTVENGRVIVLFAMRSDFVSNCATYPALNELLSQEFRQIGAMQPEELVAAIALPAKEVGLPIEEELIARIINDMKGEPGALPLMQFALKDLFDSQQAKDGIIALTLEDYLRHGGIQKSLERHADASLAALDEKSQTLARSIFSGLIEIGRGTQDTKRTALFDELVPANASTEEVLAIVRKLADARLIITDEQAGKDTVTISHEKLIEAWPWLKKLVNENRDAIALQNEIASDAKEWDDHNRDESYLYTGARLANSREQVEARKLILSGLAQSFIEAGVKAHTDELEAAQQRATQLRRRSIYLTAALVAALIAVGIAVFFSLKSRERAQIALARQLTAQAQSLNATRNSQQMIAVLLAAQSMKIFPSSEAGEVLRDNFAADLIAHMADQADYHFVNSVAFSPDGKYVVTGSSDNTARVWEIATQKEIARLTHGDDVDSVAFSPNGKYVVSGGCDERGEGGHCAKGSARLWEFSTGKEIARIVYGDKVASVAFSPGGKYVVSGSWDHTARVWEASTGREVARMTHDDNVNSVAFSPDGKYVVSGSADMTARVWEAATGKEITRVSDEFGMYSAAFSPDGKYIVSGGGKTARVNEAATGKKIVRMTYDFFIIFGMQVAFSPDGKYVVSSADKTVHVWEAATGLEIAHMTHDGTVWYVAFSPDGKYVVSGSFDKTARVWEAATGKEIARMTHDGSVTSVAFSPDGKYVVSGSGDGARVWEVASVTYDPNPSSTIISPDRKYMASEVLVPESFVTTIRISDAITGKEVARMTHDHQVNSFAFSPDSKYLVSGSVDRTARVWEATTGKEVARMIHGDWVESVAFSPDGKYVVSGGSDQTARVWEAATGKEITRMIHKGIVRIVAFSPDGKYVVSGSTDKMARVWEAATGKEITHMTHDDEVDSVAFSPDGKYVVSGSWDHTARIWEAATGKEVARKSHNDMVWYVAFSPDGKYVLSETGERLTTHWLWRPNDLIADACSRMPRNLTRAEWKQYINDALPYQAVCSNLQFETGSSVVPNYYYALISFWPITLYLIYGWVAYRKITSQFHSRYLSNAVTFLWRRIAISVFQGGLLILLVLSGFYLTAIGFQKLGIQPANSAVSPLISLWIVPSGVWAGAVYSHLTRDQADKLSRTKRVIFGSMAGFVSSFLCWGLVLTMLVLFVIPDSLPTNFWPQILLGLGVLGGLGAVLSAVGVLIYIFGIQKWMTKSMLRKQIASNP